ncbi:SICA antigen [Plasmodium coatneyi]|uniref:SICA antigen n=1 Tax=Plasmodium coatneyi TaxID=208452 RepID=A0A1B1DZH7_9APIC|nr:SICA antigen [Plasmodium coatneyi]ANQ07997.1 SICA antigen [Plasmodium coatneyi]
MVALMKEEERNKSMSSYDKVKENVGKEVTQMLSQLKDYMGMDEKRNTTRIADICGHLKHSGKGPGDTNQLKKICKSLVNVVYWMEGWDKGKNRWKVESGKGEPWESYLKCIMGNNVILRIVRDKCDIEPIMEVIANTMEGKGEHFPNSGKTRMECDWVKTDDIKNGGELIGVTMEDWLEGAKSRKGGVTGLLEITEWMKCGSGEEMSDGKNEKKNCRSVRIIDLMNWGRSKELGDLVDTKPARGSQDDTSGGPKSSVSPGKNNSNVHVQQEEEDELPTGSEGYVPGPAGGSSPRNDTDVVDLITYGTGKISEVTFQKPTVQVEPQIPPGFIEENKAKPGSRSAETTPTVIGTRKDPDVKAGSDAQAPTETKNHDGTQDDASKTKYFVIPGKRRRSRRAHKIPDSPPLEEQLLDHVDDEVDGPHEYTLVKERRQPSSAPTKTKRSKKQGVHLPVGSRGVRRRMIIDIHLEVLNECQKGDLHLTKEDFFEILVKKFMGSRFREEDFVPKGDVPKEQVPSSDSAYKQEDFLPKEGAPIEKFPKEQVPCSDSGF